MIVHPDQPFEIIYSLYTHEYLGILFESYAVQLDEQGRLSLANQNISYQNASEFDSKLNEADYKLIKLMDEMGQEVIVKPYIKRNIRPKDYLRKIYDQKTADEKVQALIQNDLEDIRAKILPLLVGKRLFEMANDKNPIWKEIRVHPKPVTTHFHFFKNEDNTHYKPVFKHEGEKLEIDQKGGQLLCKEPAWLLMQRELFHFDKNLDGKKLLPFLNKKFVVIEKRFEPTYYRGFIATLLSEFDVVPHGFEIKVERGTPQVKVGISDLASASTGDLFENREVDRGESQIAFELRFQYGDIDYRADQQSENNVRLEEKDGEYTFYKVVRSVQKEKSFGKLLHDLGLPIRKGRVAMPKTQAFDWITENEDILEENGIRIVQVGNLEGKIYHIGKAQISIEVNENIDWFDVHAKIKFGLYLVSFTKLRKLMMSGKTEFELPMVSLLLFRPRGM